MTSVCQVSSVTSSLFYVTRLTGARPGAEVRCLAENTLGVATAENELSRVGGLELRMAEMERRMRADGDLLNKIAISYLQSGDLEVTRKRLKERIRALEDKVGKSQDHSIVNNHGKMKSMNNSRLENVERASNGRDDLIKILESKIEVIDKFQRTHFVGHQSNCESKLSKIADNVQEKIHHLKSKISHLNAQFISLEKEVYRMKEDEISMIEINKLLGHTRVSSSLTQHSADYVGVSSLVFIITIILHRAL